MTTRLSWLPPPPDDWRSRVRGLAQDPRAAWEEAAALARYDLDFTRTGALDTALRTALGARSPAASPVRLALLGSATLSHLQAGLRVAWLRRGIDVAIHENEFGQYWQEIADTASPLHAFAPTATLLSLDAHHLIAGLDARMTAAEAEAALEDVIGRIQECWSRLHAAFGCHVIQQAPLPLHPPLLGQNEHRMPGSPAAFLAKLATALRPLADAAGVDVLALDHRIAQDGLAAWHDPAMWHRAKHEIAASAAPLHGDLAVRLLAAKQGRSSKCLVLDLDNTIWGGVVGDDGLDGLVLGQGSPLGEAYTAVQQTARDLSRRGVILAVCSKNDEANAREPFERHPEMVLRSADIACFTANWNDKPANLRAIATALNIGLDALVFLDDNPFERTLVRQELPMVAVPEISDDPTDTPRILADAGYFESLWITDEDRTRTAHYRGNQQREALREAATDLPAYLRGLDMRLLSRPFDSVGLQRTVQLINKTNQFNLTTRRVTDQDVLAIMADPLAFGLQLRLLDRFGDNGIIAILSGRQHDAEVDIDLWLMSCRVLGRQVEAACLNLLASLAIGRGADRLLGTYRPTPKNAMVCEHYARLGFTLIDRAPDGTTRHALDLAGFQPLTTSIAITEG